ncbi:MAG: hypothetical protein H0U95_05055 [Bacteroidetes bacterium]|nr:hypothetical protein [Bacteroidota bacterium]
MANWKKIGIISGIGAGVVGLATYAHRLSKASNDLQTVVKTNIHSLKADGLTIRIDVQIKNPSPLKFKIKYPFVLLKYKEATVGTSKVINETITIPKNGEVNVNGIMINLPLSNIFSVGFGLVKNLLQRKPSIITVTTQSQVDLGWKKLAYEKSQDFTLKPKA